ncbi:transposase [Chryseobacterium aahli]|uniref:transposase n=1 Tax=Chryseobacterium aahli TaxID=1278643 RepID=UPI00374DAD21
MSTNFNIKSSSRLCLGYEESEVHFLIQSVPNLSVNEICMKVKSITVKEISKRFPEINAKLRGGNFWISGYHTNTVGPYINNLVMILPF